MLFWLCVVINIIAIARFIYKKQKAVALVYSAVFLILCFFGLFYIRTPEMVSFLKDILGEHIYKELAYAISFDLDDTFAPFYGIQLVTIIISTVSMIETADKVVRYIFKHNNKPFSVTNNHEFVFNGFVPENTVFNNKIYLENCSFLC